MAIIETSWKADNKDLRLFGTIGAILFGAIGLGALLKIVWPDVIAGIPMPDYDDHAPNDAQAAPSAPGGAKERLLGDRSKAPPADQGAAVPGVREGAGGSVEPSGSGARSHVQGDSAGSPGEHHPTVPAVSHGAARELEQVPAAPARRAPRAGKTRMGDHQTSIPTV